MIRFARTIAISTLLCASPALAAPPPSDKRLERLAEAERELVKDPAKLRLRHNLEGLAARYRKLAEATSGADKQAALAGEARALALLARYSGVAADRAAAERAEAKLKAPPAKLDPTKDRAKAERPRAVAAARLDKLELVTRELGVELVLPQGVKLESKPELLAATKQAGARVVFELSPIVVGPAALKPLAIEHPGVAALRVAQVAPARARFVFQLPAGVAAPELTGLVGGAQPRLRVGKKGDWDAPRVDPKAEESLAALLEVQRALAEVAPGEAAIVTPEARAALEAMVAELRGDDEEAPAVGDESDEIQLPEAKETKIEVLAPEGARVAAPAPAVGVNATTRAALAEKKSHLVRVRRVLIDAGHGGKDTGAIGKKGTREKDVNLGIALALAKVLREKHGLEVVLTRSTDVYLSLGKRVDVANRSGADLFVSVHSNAHRNRKFQGVETYYLNTTSNRYANRLAARENQEQFDESTLDAGDPGEAAADDDAGALPGGAMGRDLRLLLADLAMRSATDDSRRLAGLVQSSVIGELRKLSPEVADFGVKHALFYVLLGSRMPSILVETGFLSNADEERRLGDPSYQRKVAEAIAAGVRRFVDEREQLASRN